MRRPIRAALGAALTALSLTAAAAGPTRAAPAATRSAAAAASSPAAAASAPSEFTGTFEAGQTYVAEVNYDARALRTWRPAKEVRVAKNVAWTIDWSNIGQFPHLKTPAAQARPQRFTFRVAKNELVSGSPAMPWMATYHCEIVAVDPVAPAAAPAAAGHSRGAPKKR
jgi:hypothetical protein